MTSFVSGAMIMKFIIVRESFMLDENCAPKFKNYQHMSNQIPPPAKEMHVASPAQETKLEMLKQWSNFIHFQHL